MTTFSPKLLALVAAGGALGSVLRYVTVVLCAQLFGTMVPWGTLAVNVVGSGIIGLLGGAGLAQAAEARLFVVTGMLGGFTTFSAFSLDTGLLWQRSPALALAYVMASVGLGLLTFALCFSLGRRF